jgi:hypothetical protein
MARRGKAGCGEESVCDTDGGGNQEWHSWERKKSLKLKKR